MAFRQLTKDENCAARMIQNVEGVTQYLLTFFPITYTQCMYRFCSFFFVFLCTHTNLMKNLDKCNSRVLDGRHSVDEKGWCVVESDVRD